MNKYNSILLLFCSNLLVTFFFISVAKFLGIANISYFLKFQYIIIFSYYLLSFFAILIYFRSNAFVKNLIKNISLLFLSLLIFLTVLKLWNFEVSFGNSFLFTLDNTDLYLYNFLASTLILFLVVTNRKISFEQKNRNGYLLIKLFKRYEFLKNKKISLFIAGLIILLGIILRVLGVFQFSPWFDEGISMLVAERIAEGHGHTLLTDYFYNRALLYHEYLALWYKSFNSLYGYGVLANTPFFIGTSIIIYKLARRMFNRWTALLALLFYSFSWFSIAEFRFIRFYEYFVFFFQMSIYFLYLLLEKLDIRKDLNTLKISLKLFALWIDFIKKNIVLIIFFTISFLLALDAQLLAAFLIPSLAVFSLLYALITGKKQFLILFLISLLLWTIANFIRYQEDFSFILLIIQPEVNWLKNIERTDFFNTWKDFVSLCYPYAPIIFLIISIVTFFKKKKLMTSFLVIISISYFALVAIQGTGTSALRYFYPIAPLIAIVSSFSFFEIKNLLTSRIKSPIITSITFFSLLLLLLISLYPGLKESFSSYTNTSKIGTHNLEYRDFFKLINKYNLDSENYLIAGDTHMSLMYYLEMGSTPTFSVHREEMNYNSTDIYLNIPIIGYGDFEKIRNQEKHKKVLFLYDNRWEDKKGKFSIFNKDYVVLEESNGMMMIQYSY